MRIVLEGEDRIRLEMTGEGFEISSEGASISPYHLLAGSLASCTALTVESWAQGVGIEVRPLTVSVGWEMADDRPKRITHLDMELRWPGLPEERVKAAERAADLCPIHETLQRATEISRRVVPS
jgi:uncharacterized OsmC-like protein